VALSLGNSPLAGYSVFGSLFRGSGSWVVDANPMPFGGLTDHGVVAQGDYAYLFGGSRVDSSSDVTASSSSLFGQLWRYSAVYQSWTQLAPMPVSTTRFGYTIGGGVIWTVGGIGGAVTGGFGSPCISGGPPMNSTAQAEGADPGCTGSIVQRYSIASNSWTAGPSLAVPRSDSCAAVIGSKLYSVGGYSAGYNISDVVEVLDTSAAAPAWARLPPLPSPRGDLSCIALNGLLYVFGGFYNSHCANASVGNNCFYSGPTPQSSDAAFVAGVSSYRKDVWALDPTTTAWRAKAPMIYGRADNAFTVLPNGRILAAGGEHGLATTLVKVPMHSVEIYSAADDAWAEKSPMPFARFRFGAVSIGQTAHAFGGAAVCFDSQPPDGVTAGGRPLGNVTQCQSTASGTSSAFYELDHPDVFVQLRSGAAAALSNDDAIEAAMFVAGRQDPKNPGVPEITGRRRVRRAAI